MPTASVASSRRRRSETDGARSTTPTTRLAAKPIQAQRLSVASSAGSARPVATAPVQRTSPVPYSAPAAHSGVTRTRKAPRKTGFPNVLAARATESTGRLRVPASFCASA
jgi:hypothetical protein